MSININSLIDDLISALVTEIESIEAFATPFILEQDTEPRQNNWEDAWVAAGHTLPIPEDQELYWKAGEFVRGQFACTNDRFYCLFPSNSVSLAGVVHFAYTKFLGWEDEQHFLFSGTQLNTSGQYSGLLRAYLDGTCEQVDFTGFTANTLLGYDEAQGKLWYIEGTDLKRIDTTTEVITVIANGITVAPTAIAFDGAGDAFCTINIGAGLDLYRWNNGVATFSSFKASITVNGASVDPGQVIAASLNYVVVNTAVSNYWVQIARAGGAETQIKSNPAGATSDNLPQPNATAWIQTFAAQSLDVLSIVYTELSGTPGLSDWRKTFLWDMSGASYTESDVLPYDDFIAMCINRAPSAEPTNYAARRDINYHTLTSAYRKRVSSAWEYHNLSNICSNIANSRRILETDDGQIFVWAGESSGKIWRISAWDTAEADAVVLGIIDPLGIVSVESGGQHTIRWGYIDISDRPSGFNLIEITSSADLSNNLASVRSGNLYNDLAGVSTAVRNSGIVHDTVNANSTSYSQNTSLRVYASANNTTQGAMVRILLFIDEEDFISHCIVVENTLNTGSAGATVSFSRGVNFPLKATFADFEELYININTLAAVGVPVTHLGGYFMVRALRTEGRRQGGSYYDPAMA